MFRTKTGNNLIIHRRWYVIWCRPPTTSAADQKNRYSTFGPLSKVRTFEKTAPKTTTEIYYQYYQWFISFVENYRRQIFWAVLYTLVLFGVFIERGYCKSQRLRSSIRAMVFSHHASVQTCCSVKY